MKLLLALVTAAVLAAIGATVWVGARLREDTVVSDPYGAGLRWDADHRGSGSPARPALSAALAPAAGPRTASACDLSGGPCTLSAGPLAMTLDLSPRPARAMARLRVAAEVRDRGRPLDGADVAVSFAMRGMYMGEHRVALAPAGGGAYVGEAILVRCPTGRRDWTAELTVRRPGAAPVARAFDVRVAE